ncbi:MAG: hypothetical protein ACK559_08065, partial [bacterium]
PLCGLLVRSFRSFIGNFNLVDWKKLEKQNIYHHFNFNFYEKDQDQYRTSAGLVMEIFTYFKYCMQINGLIQNLQRSFHIVTASSLTYVADASTVYRALGGTPGAI